MKTSNKLLIIAFILILSGAFFVIYKVKTFINIYTNEEVVYAKDLDLSGEVIEKTYQLQSFNNIRLDGGIKANLFKGDKNEMILHGDSTLIHYVEIEEHDGKLVVKLTSVKGKNIKVYADIYSTSLEIDDLNINAGASLNSEESIEVEDMDIDVNAGAHLNVILHCDKVNISCNAGAQAYLNGTTKDLSASANAGAFIKAKDLKAQKVNASANAGGHVTVYASEKIDASCVAGGNVSYAGNPEKVSKSTVAGGTLSKID